MAREVKKNKDLIDNLPKDWREQGAKKFTCSVSKIEKVVYGLNNDIDVFAYMTVLAEEEKQRVELLQKEIDKRLNVLAK